MTVSPIVPLSLDRQPIDESAAAAAELAPSEKGGKCLGIEDGCQIEELADQQEGAQRGLAAQLAASKGRVRFYVAILGLLIAVVNCYAQATFCIAIVEMVFPADYVASNTVRAGFDSRSENASSIADNSCPIDYQYRHYYDTWRFSHNSSSSESAGAIDFSDRFDWDASQQGLLLGAFAMGTAPLQVLGGRLAEIYGPKWVLLAGCIGTALTNLTIPFLARFSFLLLILNRVLMGVAQAGMEPGLMCLMAAWLTPAETGLFISMLLFAICVGFFLGSLCSSFLLALGYGWPLVYYVAGAMNLSVSVLWLHYASSKPSESRLISPEELKHIEHAQRLAKAAELSYHHKQAGGNGSGTLDLSKADREDMNRIRDISKLDKLESAGSTLRQDFSQLAQAEQSCRAPWRNILGCRSVWAFIICKISIRWCADVLSIELPTYLANVLHLSIKLNGILNSVSSALFAIFSFITGYVVNEILKRQQKRQLFQLQEDANGVIKPKGISKTNLRKAIQSVASFGSAITLILMTQYDCNILFSMSMLLILSCCLVMGTGGELQIPFDMSSKYPGTLHGMACTLSVSGWLAPPLIGLILGDEPSSRYRWTIVWHLTAAINLIGGLVFVLFADASPRDFDRGGCSSSSRERRRQRRLQGELSGERGRHLASYDNAACRLADAGYLSPSAWGPQPAVLEGGAAAAQAGAKEEPFSWPRFDRTLVRTEAGSLAPSSFLRGLEPAIVTSYQTGEALQAPDSVGQPQSAVRRLWARLIRRRRRSRMSVDKRIAAPISGSEFCPTSRKLEPDELCEAQASQHRQGGSNTRDHLGDQQLVLNVSMATAVEPKVAKTITHL